jgi:hypothetical protein
MPLRQPGARAMLPSKQTVSDRARFKRFDVPRVQNFLAVAPG